MSVAKIVIRLSVNGVFLIFTTLNDWVVGGGYGDWTILRNYLPFDCANSTTECERSENYYSNFSQRRVSVAKISIRYAQRLGCWAGWGDWIIGRLYVTIIVTLRSFSCSGANSTTERDRSENYYSNFSSLVTM